MMCWTPVRVSESCPRPRMVLQSYDLEYSSNNVSGSRKRIVIAVVVMVWQSNWCGGMAGTGVVHVVFSPSQEFSRERPPAAQPRCFRQARWTGERCARHGASRCACICVCRASLDLWDARISSLVLGELSGFLGRARLLWWTSARILTGHTFGARSTLPCQVDVFIVRP